MNDDNRKPGPTNEYHDGMLGEKDEGGLQYAIGTVEGKIILNFGTSVKWLGMSPDEALRMAELLTKRAHAMKALEKN